MPNPYLPPWEYIPDGEPRVFGDRVYVYGSHDEAGSMSPTGPFKYRGYIVDNGVDYPAGNNHGSICCINGQWYIFYHRMTNRSMMSRRGCVEKIEILPDGTIPPVEMTSLGFEDSLLPYRITPAEYACVLKNGPYVTEKNEFNRVVTNIQDGGVLGYKYFDFGDDNSSKTMEFAAEVVGLGCDSTIHILLDGEDGEEIGTCKVGRDSGMVKSVVKAVTGRHSVFFKVTTGYKDLGWMSGYFAGKNLFELKNFVFMK